MFDLANAAFWLIIAPVGIILWIGFVGFAFWLITDPLCNLCEKIGYAFERGRQLLRDKENT